MTAYLATACLAAAIMHTFAAGWIHRQALRWPKTAGLFHVLAEVELVFALWAAVFLAGAASLQWTETFDYVRSRDFTEPLFILVIMSVCATQPVLATAEAAIRIVSRKLPLPPAFAFYITSLTLGPLLGSFITEPAAMTVTALILLRNLYAQQISERLRYATLGLLFVNISIGGTVTPYAAPPVLMVASLWNWDLSFMLTHFAWKTVLAVFISAPLTAYLYRRELGALRLPPSNSAGIPRGISALHLVLTGAVVYAAHSPFILTILFAVFLGMAWLTRQYQNKLKIKEAALVAVFLGGLVVLGGQQGWWLAPVLRSLNALPLFLGSALLTAIADNAAITYLGAQVSGLSEVSRYALVAGSVTGGGLTVIANAPNPAGLGLLGPSFLNGEVKALRLLLHALTPTLVAAACFWLL